jgi:3-dehydroquinate synthase
MGPPAVESRASPPAVVEVDTPGGRYEIRIGSGLLAASSTWSGLPRAADAVIVSNPLVWNLFGAQLAAAIAPHHRSVTQVLLPDGELH